MHISVSTVHRTNDVLILAVEGGVGVGVEFGRLVFRSKSRNIRVNHYLPVCLPVIEHHLQGPSPEIGSGAKLYV